VGEHSREVLMDLGVDPADIASLAAAGVLSGPDLIAAPAR